MDNFKQEVATSIAKVTPPAGVSMWLTLGNHIDDWIKLATLVYIIVQVTAVVIGKYLQWTGRLLPKKGPMGELDEL
jgi:hypothetical protein